MSPPVTKCRMISFLREKLQEILSEISLVHAEKEKEKAEKEKKLKEEKEKKQKGK